MLSPDSSADRKPSDDHSSATPPISPISAAFDSRLRTTRARSDALVLGNTWLRSRSSVEDSSGRPIALTRETARNTNGNSESRA